MLDLSALHAINGLAGSSAALDAVMRVLANDSPYLVAMVLVWAWIKPGAQRQRRRIAAAVAAVSGLLGLAIAGGIGHVYYRPRPFLDAAAQVRLLVPHAADSSFPSDHATLAFAVAAGLFAAGAAWGWPMLVFAFAVAFARVYVGVHWPSDVVAGALLGLLCAWAMGRLARRFAPQLDAALARLGPLGR